MRAWIILALSMLVLFGLSFAVNVAACQALSSPNTYTLNTSVSGAPSTGSSCIYISSSNVIFDCNGYNITGPGYGYGVYIPGPLTNVTVKNCPRISNYQYGIYLSQTNNSLFANNSISANSYGLWAQTSSTNNTFSKNSFTGNTYYNFFLSHSDFNNVTSNIANGSQVGFFIDYANNNNISNNIIFGASGSVGGLYSQWNGGNIYINNTVHHNAPYGLYVSLTLTTTTFINNTFYSNSGPGLYTTANYMVMANNTFFNNSPDIDLSSSWPMNMQASYFLNPSGTLENYTSLSLSQANYNGEYIIKWSSNSSALPAGNTSFAQKFVNISLLSGSFTIDSITWGWQPSELSGYDESKFQLWKYGGSWSSLNNTPNITAHTLSLTNMNPASIYGILQNGSGGGGTPCPVLASSLTMTGNLAGSPNNAAPLTGFTACVVMNAPNIVLDCAGYSITGNTSGSTIGVMVNSTATNATIKNCPGISNYTYSVYSYSASNVSIRNNTAFNFSQNGFYVNGGSNINVTNSTAKNSPGAGGFDAANGNWIIFLNDSAYNLSEGIRSQVDNTRIVNNTVRNATGFGIIVIAGNNTVAGNAVNQSAYGYDLSLCTSLNASGNTATNSPIGFGIYATNSSSFTNNTVRNSTSKGFDLMNSYSNNLAGNNVSGSYYGFFSSSSSNTYTSNMAFSNSQIGFSIDASYNTITSNSAYNNSNTGFDIGYLSSHNTLTSNLAYNNSGIGFSLGSSSDYNSLSGNSAYNNTQTGFYLNGQQNTLTGNSAYNNSGNGFSLNSGTSNALTGNNASSNLNNGFELDYETGITLSGNSAYKNSYDGFIINPGSSISMTGNAAYNNSQIGFSLVSSSDSITGNTAYNNTGAGFSITTNSSTISGNSAYRNRNNGFEVGYLSNSNTISSNSAYNNSGSGFSLGSSFTNNYLSGNSAYNNTQSGFYLTGDSNTVIGNSAYNNSDAGFYLNSGTGNSLTGNTAYLNRHHGFELDYETNDYLSGNAAFNTTGAITPSYTEGSGFYVYYGSGSQLSGNSAYNNSAFGLYLDYTSSGFFTGNSVFGNPYGGFHLEDCYNNNLDNNDVHDNGACFDFAHGSYNTLFNNTVHGCYQGFYLWSSDYNELTSNTAHSNYIGMDASCGLNNDMVNDTYFNNTNDLVSNCGTEGETSFYMTTDYFLNPSGTLENFTALSISDYIYAGDELHVDWAGGSVLALPPGVNRSFAEKFIDISKYTTYGGSNVPINAITWSWTASELTGYNESRFQIWVDNGTWNNEGAYLNTGAHTLYQTDINDSGTFAILEAIAPPVPPETSPPSNKRPSLAIGMDSSCDGNVITVTGKGEAVPGASLSVFDANTLADEASGSADENGTLKFDGCGKTLRVHAEMEGYLPQDASFRQVACGQCVECSSDGGCPDTKMCSENKCIPVVCQCGSVSSHQCNAYSCCKDSDCSENQKCQDHSCKAKPGVCTAPSCCTADSQCADSQFCATVTGAPGSEKSPGSCQDITGKCGEARNHVFVPYGFECGSEPGCPSCLQGTCTGHKCVGNDLKGPQTGFVGDSAKVQASEGDGACKLCDIQGIDPTGKPFTGKTGPDGSFELPLTLKGTYNVSLLKNGAVVKTIQINSIPRAPPAETAKPTATSGTEFMSLLWLLVLLVALVLGIVYWRSRQKPDKKK